MTDKVKQLNSNDICAPRKGDHCVKCGRLLTLVDEPENGAPGHEPVVMIQGEVDCCCGDYDNDGHHVNATCSNCCGPHINPNPGSGYFIVSSSR